ncbi:DHH family phosphoesterase [Candidatus Microgenomates bacterium]|nr:DHH family phosphoesterase [Candidatus Microgenomates bacterium]
MTDKVKKLAPAIWAEIQKAKRVLLHCHPSPDPDSLGGVLAMKFLLENLGKRATVIAGDSLLTTSMAKIPGFDQIVKKNYFEINLADFDLFIILDSSALGQISKKGRIVFPESLATVKIDHHRNEDDFAKVNLVDTSYPATCQIIYDLIKTWGQKITPQMAAGLFIGIYTDTGGFKYPPTSDKTLLAAADLAKIYPDYHKIIFDYENSVNPKELEFLSLALGTIDHYFNNSVAISAVPFAELSKRQIAPENVHEVSLANYLVSVPGWIIGIRFTETTPNVVNLSFRRREGEGPDLSKVAIALGGGGHSAAAGATINKPFAEAKELLLKTLQKVYPELGKP